MIRSKYLLEILTDTISKKEHIGEDTAFSCIFDRKGRFGINYFYRRITYCSVFFNERLSLKVLGNTVVSP